MAEAEQDTNVEASQAAKIVAKAREGPDLVLLRDRPDAAVSAESWKPFVEDVPRRSFAYVVPRESGALAPEDLERWFQALHPHKAGVGPGAWSDAHFRGRKLLRKTAWYVWPPCGCKYDYADTHQEVLSEPEMSEALEDISRHVFRACGVEDDPPNSVNLNFYPAGGGVGFHSDDEPLFDGLAREVAIISLSLSENGGADGLGSRWFEVRPKRAFGPQRCRPHAVELRHGDIMTMEGLFQLHYVHSAWPGDRDDVLEAPGRTAYGERVNLTWRWIVAHSEGCPCHAVSSANPRLGASLDDLT